MANNGVDMVITIRKEYVVQEAVDHARDIIHEVANTAVEYAKEMSPVLTGHHRSTITSAEDPTGRSEIGFVLYSQSGYGNHLEFGTKHMAARPHIRPGIERAIQEAQHRGDLPRA